MNPASTTPPATMSAMSSRSTIRCALAPRYFVVHLDEDPRGQCRVHERSRIRKPRAVASRVPSTVGLTDAGSGERSPRRIGVGVVGGRKFGRCLRSALRSNLRSASLCLAFARRLCALRLQELRHGHAHRSGGRAGHTAEGGCAGGTNKYSSDVMDHCATRAHCANPASGGVLHSAALRCGRDSE